MTIILQITAALISAVADEKRKDHMTTTSRRSRQRRDKRQPWPDKDEA